jgi:hypothetical protein
MHRPDEKHQQEASPADLLTELLLPVYVAAWTNASARSEQLRPSVTSGDEVQTDEAHGVVDEADTEDDTFLTFCARALSILLKGWVADRRLGTGTFPHRLKWIASRGVGERRLRDTSVGRVLALRQSQGDGRDAWCYFVVSPLTNRELEWRDLGPLGAAWSATTTPVRSVVCGTPHADLVRTASDC